VERAKTPRNLAAHALLKGKVMHLRFAPLAVAIVLAGPAALAATRTVGPGKAYAKPCLAFAAAAAGDTIEIDAGGNYDGDVCIFNKDNLTIKGVGGRAKVDAAGKNAGGKAIWVIQGDNTTIEDVELSGCTVADKNGAGIRQEGNNLTLRRVFFHDNENGILGGGDNTSTVIIEDSEFARNGAGDGYSHNMYIAEIKSFTIRGSYSHHAKIGHLVKSRALENNVLYNRLTDETGTASYEIDLPQGGKSFVIGNIIQQSSSTDNPSLISFARESKRNPNTALYVVNNTFFNSRSAGTFVAVADDVTTVVLRNNIFGGPGTLTTLAAAVKDNNFVGDAMFVNTATFDFHLKAGSPAIDKGVAPGSGAGTALDPLCQYVHPARAYLRKNVGTLDQGGFELGGETTTPCSGTLPPGDAGPPMMDASPPGDSAVADTATTPPSDSDVPTDTGAPPIGDDSGVTADTGSSTTPDDDSGVVNTDAPTESEAGCGCTTPGRATSSWGALALLLIALRVRGSSARSARR
jgi:hypothetical protein